MVLLFYLFQLVNLNLRIMLLLKIEGREERLQNIRLTRHAPHGRSHSPTIRHHFLLRAITAGLPSLQSGRRMNREPNHASWHWRLSRCCKSQHNFIFQFNYLSRIRIRKWNRVVFCNIVVLIDPFHYKFYLIISKN